MAMSRKHRLMVIGVDGATFDLIQPWLEEGRLPNMKRLVKQGVHGRLTSTIHPLSPPAWTSFMTGVNQGKHGIYDFVLHAKDRYELIYANGGMRQSPSVWRLLSDAGKRVCVMNVLMTYPPEPVNGCLIAGGDAPGLNSGFTYPKELYEEIRQQVGGYTLRDYPHRQDPASFLQQIHDLIDNHRKTALYLFSKEPWDFFMVVFMATDLVQHAYWQYMGVGQVGNLPDRQRFAQVSESDRQRFRHAIRGVYERLDEVVGELVDAAGNDVTVILMSDHGGGPCYKVVFLDKWLEQQGLLHYRISDSPIQCITRRSLSAAHRALKKTLPPQSLEALVRRLPRLRQRVKSEVLLSKIDWEKTRAYSFGRESTNIFINLKGKFPHGTVASGKDYDRLCEDIRSALMELEDPDTQEPVVDYVYRKEEIYHGPCLSWAPDLIVCWKNYEYVSRPGYDDERRELFESSLAYSEMSEVSQLQKGGTHRLEGIFIACGEPFRKGKQLMAAHITDLAPTILYLMDAPIPTYIDGRVLVEAIDESFLKTHQMRLEDMEPSPPSPSARGLGEGDRGGEGSGGETLYTPEQSRAIEERLRGLGYIE